MTDTRLIEGYLSTIEDKLNNIEVHLAAIATTQGETNEVLSKILNHISHIGLNVQTDSTLKDIYLILRELSREGNIR